MKTNNTMRYLVALLLIGGALLVMAKPWWTPQEVKQENPQGSLQRMSIGQTVIEVEIRKTAEEHELGLSYRKSMPKNQGMLFQYAHKETPLYWMKGMEFPLDFIWIADGLVVETTEAVPAPSLGTTRIATVMPKQPVDAVLEVNAGFVIEHEIKPGDIVKMGN